MDDAAGEFAEAERRFRAEIEQRADDDQQAAENEKSATEFAERIHKNIIKSQIAARESRATGKSYCIIYL